MTEFQKDFYDTIKRATDAVIAEDIALLRELAKH